MNVYYVGGMPISDELYHHGIKGQKWGIRRWQNEDGSLTPAGKAKYGTVENFNRAQAMKNAKKARNDAVSNAAVRTGLAFNLTKSGREKSKNAFDEVKRTNAEYKKAKGVFEKSNNTKKVQNARDKQKRSNAEKTKYGRDIAKSLLKAGGYGALAYININNSKDSSLPSVLRLMSSVAGGAAAGYAIRSLGDTALTYGKHWSQKIEKAEKEAKKRNN